MIDTKALRSRILDLAIQGKLTEQLPSDGTADDLLSHINKEKIELIQKGKIPKEKPLPEISADEIAFEIPNNWKWVRVQDIASYITDYVANGSFATLKAHTQTYKEPNYAIFVRTMDFSSDFKSDCSYIDKESYDFLEKSRLYGGELILPNIGASIGKAFIMPDLGMPMSLAPNSILLKFTEPVMNIYFSFIVKSRFGSNLLNITQGGSATAKFSKTDLRSLIVPIPPLAEQKRIVERVEEIFRLLDTIDQAQEKYSADSQILKAKLITAGIQGKLTKQLPSDGTAEALFSTKTKAITADTPFEIPSNWKWCRGIDCLKPMETRKPSGDTFSYIDIDAIDNKNQTIRAVRKVATKDAPSRASRAVFDGSVLFSLVRPYLRNIALVDNKSAASIASTGFFVATSNGSLYPLYLFYLMISDYVVMGLNEYMKGDNSPSIRKGHIEQWLFPVPPLAEQKRIAETLERALGEIG